MNLCIGSRADMIGILFKKKQKCLNKKEKIKNIY